MKQNVIDGPLNLKGFSAHFEQYLRQQRLTPAQYAERAHEIESKVIGVINGEEKPTRQMLIDSGWREMIITEERRVWVEETYYVKVKEL